MFDIASDWKQRINESRQATLDDEGKILSSIPAIEPDYIFTSNIVGIYVNSPSAPNNWYAAGDFLQAYLVGFGTAGYAQGEYLRLVLNRYHVHRFTRFPSYPDDSKYLISFVPKPYLKDINIKVWEYIGTQQGETLESLSQSIKAVQQTVMSQSAAVKALINKSKKV